MERLTAFVQEHIADDTSRLILNRSRWPEIDMDLAVNCIESRRKLRGKVQEWVDNPDLIFPRKVSAEQCSSSATGRYKAELAERIFITADQYDSNGTSESAPAMRLADLTGGLGVDSWYFSQKAEKVLYCEMLPELCRAAEHNFKVLDADNIEVRNHAVTSISKSERTEGIRNDNVMSSEYGTSVFLTPEEILKDFQADIVYMDPARRGEGGRKVFLIEDCTPDVLTLKDEVFRFSRHILLKLSPMADISMVCDRLGSCCREVHVVAAGGECKELLVWMDREWSEEHTVHAVELHKDGSRTVFSFRPSEERIAGQAGNDGKGAKGIRADRIGEWAAIERIADNKAYLFEPGKALMKAGAYNLIAERFGVHKLGRSTHYYIYSAYEQPEGSCGDGLTRESMTIRELQGFGKVFRIISCSPLDKRTLKAAGKEYPHSEVTARNISMDTDTMRKKAGITSGDDAHIFGLKSDSEGQLLFITVPTA